MSPGPTTTPTMISASSAAPTSCEEDPDTLRMKTRSLTKGSSPLPENNNDNNVLRGSSGSNANADGEDAITDTIFNYGSKEEYHLMNDLTPLTLVPRNILIFILLHTAAAYGAWLWVSGAIGLATFLWGFHYYVMSGFGITAGNHRLWAHKSYKAKLPLQVFLGYMQTISFQNSIHEWCRDHRLHHKYAETNADPHNAKRGFFFAHMGWLMARKHPMVKVKGKGVDMRDLEADPLVMWQKKYYLILVLFGCFVIPTMVPWYFWGETLKNAFFFAAMFRYCATLHMTWLVNSAAHLWGPRPYDKRINPAENRSVAWWAFGEGWHNYHHIFPWDYKTAEVGIYRYNFSAAFIDAMAWLGLAYDLKTVPASVVKARVLRTGDGSHGQVDHHIHGGPWGWGDKDIPKGDLGETTILYQQQDKECKKSRE